MRSDDVGTNLPLVSLSLAINLSAWYTNANTTSARRPIKPLTQPKHNTQNDLMVSIGLMILPQVMRINARDEEETMKNLFAIMIDPGLSAARLQLG